jgi:hypothetical protein
MSQFTKLRALLLQQIEFPISADFQSNGLGHYASDKSAENFVILKKTAEKIFRDEFLVPFVRKLKAPGGETLNIAEVRTDPSAYADDEIYHLWGYMYGVFVAPGHPVLVQVPAGDRQSWVDDGSLPCPPGAYLTARIHGYKVIAYHNGKSAGHHSADKATFEFDTIHYVLPDGTHFSVKTPEGVVALSNGVLHNIGKDRVKPPVDAFVPEVIQQVLNRYPALKTQKEHQDSLSRIAFSKNGFGQRLIQMSEATRVRLEFYEKDELAGLF